jgi:hypothetical protein
MDKVVPYHHIYHFWIFHNLWRPGIYHFPILNSGVESSLFKLEISKSRRAHLSATFPRPLARTVPMWPGLLLHADPSLSTVPCHRLRLECCTNHSACLQAMEMPSVPSRFPFPFHTPSQSAPSLLCSCYREPPRPPPVSCTLESCDATASTPLILSFCLSRV